MAVLGALVYIPPGDGPGAPCGTDFLNESSQTIKYFSHSHRQSFLHSLLSFSGLRFCFDKRFINNTRRDYYYNRSEQEVDRMEDVKKEEAKGESTATKRSPALSILLNERLKDPKHGMDSCTHQIV